MEGVYVLVENVRVAGECPTVRVSEEWVLGGRPLIRGGGGEGVRVRRIVSMR